MKLSHTILSALLAGLILNSNIISQDKNPQDDARWSNNPSTAVYAFGNYVPLPHTPYIHFNTARRIVNTNEGPLAVNANILVLPTPGVTQTETPIAGSRNNPNFLFGSSNAVSGSSINSGSYITTNNGVSWFGSNIINNGNSNNQRGDPAPVIDKNNRVIFTHLSSTVVFGSITGMAAEYSTDFGQTFSASFQVHSSGLDDKNLTGTDDNPGSPYYGYSYMTWCNFNAGTSYCARTTNGGVSWDPAVSWNPPSGLAAQGHDVDAMPNGNVIVCYSLHGPISPWTETGVGIGISTNGGVTFTPNQPAYATNGTRSLSFNGWGIRTNGFPRMSIDKSGGPRNGWIYIVMSEYNLAPAGSDADIVMHRSTNGGLSWSAGIRVNQDPINNGKVQFFPCIKVDKSGGINIMYYDNRAFPSTGDSASVFVSRSTDGGSTWTDIEIADHHFKPKPTPGLTNGYMGDYIGIAEGNNKIWGMWTDDKSGVFNAWVGSIDLGPSITHTPLTNTENVAGPYVVNCVINPAGSNIDPAKTRLFWSRNNANITDSLLMTNTGGNNWTANIPGNGTAATYRYYIKTADAINRIATAPIGAPAILNLFLASPDVTKPVITHTPIQSIPKPSWPVAVNSVVTDNMGLDSVWVRWYKNNTGTGIKHFKLNNTGGNNFTAMFNSTQADVNYNDSIFYRIIAQDNSSNHNRDSTALHSFKLLPKATPCIGTGTTLLAWPYNTYWHDSKTHMLYTASEIISNGGAAGSIIKIGFNVVSAQSQPMNGFSVKMKNTTATSISSFETGMTEVFAGSYTAPGTGWRFINLTTPFVWNGTSNLLIEICFDNTSYTVESSVAGSSATNMCREQHGDNQAGCSFTGGTNQATRPNLCMEIDLPVGSKIVSTEVPKVFSLAQNYPNPFNPSTSIKFSVPKQSLVKLVIYDVVGREVATLVNTVKQAGNYEAIFDASNFASGVYFYRLEARQAGSSTGDFVDVKKMVLLK